MSLLHGWPWLFACLIVVFAAACGSSNEEKSTATVAPSATLAPETATAMPSPTPEPVRLDIQASRLVIPSLDLDSEVQLSQTVPYVYVPDPGCPSGPEGNDTLTVPEQGIATPDKILEGLENKAWIFGHSRWQGNPGVLYALKDIAAGAEVIIDGVDRDSGERLDGQRYVVEGLYLTDTDSGETLLNADGPGNIPEEPLVVLQTSVRERGPGKQWIFDRQELLARATNLVEGDLDDPCKYLLLFVIARPA